MIDPTVRRAIRSSSAAVDFDALIASQATWSVDGLGGAGAATHPVDRANPRIRHVTHWVVASSLRRYRPGPVPANSTTWAGRCRPCPRRYRERSRGYDDHRARRPPSMLSRRGSHLNDDQLRVLVEIDSLDHGVLALKRPSRHRHRLISRTAMNSGGQRGAPRSAGSDTHRCFRSVEEPPRSAAGDNSRGSCLKIRGVAVMADLKMTQCERDLGT